MKWRNRLISIIIPATPGMRFEDPRSIEAKLSLSNEYGFFGVGYWNAMRPFNSNWLILSQIYGVNVP